MLVLHIYNVEPKPTFLHSCVPKQKRAVSNTDTLLEQMLTEEVFSLAGPAIGGAFFETVAVADDSSDDGEVEVEIDTQEGLYVCHYT